MTRNSNEKLNKWSENWYKKRDKLIEECAIIKRDLKKHRDDLYEFNKKRTEALKNCDKYPNDWKKYQEEWMKYQEDWEKYQEDWINNERKIFKNGKELESTMGKKERNY